MKKHAQRSEMTLPSVTSLPSVLKPPTVRVLPALAVAATTAQTLFLMKKHRVHFLSWVGFCPNQKEN
jgi:hypothetical protein